MKRKDEIRDIYQTNSPDFEKDFTPQVAQEVMEQRQRELRRSRMISIFFGGTAIVLAVGLIALAARSLLRDERDKAPAKKKDVAYTPRFSLSSEASWVIAYKQDGGLDSTELGEPGEKPLSAQWVKKAAFHLIMGQQALTVGQHDEALENFRQVVDIYPDMEGIRNAMGMLCIQNEQYAEAVEHLKRAVEENETFETVNNLGTACIGIKDYEEAEQYLKRALELQPENPACHKNLAILYRDTDRTDDACFHFEKYLDLRPDDIETMQTYAMFLIKQGRWDSAAEFLEALTQEITDEAPIYFLLAQVQEKTGQSQKAIATLKRGMQLVDPDLALAWMSGDEFDELRDTSGFQTLVDELEISNVSIDDAQ